MLIDATWLLGAVVLWLLWRYTVRPKPTLKTFRVDRDETKAVKDIRLVLFAVGTRGDVQPMIALACELKRRGNFVCICAPKQFERLVTSYGVLFESCGLESLSDQEAGWLKANTESEFLSVVAEAYLPKYKQLGMALLEVCESLKIDYIITGVYGLHIALDVAERCGAKVRAIKYMPEGITRYNPPFGVESSWQHPYINLMYQVRRLVRMVLAARRYGFTKHQNEFRTQSLHINPVTAERLESGGKYLPILFAYSDQLSPRPRDWAEWHKVVGFLFSPPLPEAKLDPDLELFIQSGPAPVVVTFGSMNSLRAAGCDVVARACRACLSLGLRVVVISGWTDLDKTMFSGLEHVIVVQQAQHELLFPRCALVIHHGGAGTVARVAQAGIPSVVIPILRWLDQRGWAMAVEKFGAGIHLRSPFVEEQKIKESVSQILFHPVNSLVYGARARDLKRRLEKEGDTAKKSVDWLLAPLTPLEYDPAFYRIPALDRMVRRSCVHVS